MESVERKAHRVEHLVAVVTGVAESVRLGRLPGAIDRHVFVLEDEANPGAVGSGRSAVVAVAVTVAAVDLAALELRQDRRRSSGGRRLDGVERAVVGAGQPAEIEWTLRPESGGSVT